MTLQRTNTYTATDFTSSQEVPFLQCTIEDDDTELASREQTQDAEDPDFTSSQATPFASSQLSQRPSSQLTQSPSPQSRSFYSSETTTPVSSQRTRVLRSEDSVTSITPNVGSDDYRIDPNNEGWESLFSIRELRLISFLVTHLDEEQERTEAIELISELFDIGVGRAGYLVAQFAENLILD